MTRFVIYGAVGFGISGAIGIFYTVSPVLAPFSLLVGGAALGLALKDWRKAAILAPLGAVGLTLGIFTGLYFSYSEVPIATVAGAVAGASLGVAFGDWRAILGPAVAGAAGFGVGLLAGDFLRASFPIIRGVGEAGSITVAGLVGGASLGAALGYLEKRRPVARRRPRVR